MTTTGPTLALIPLADGSAAITGPVADVAALVEHLHATGATLTTTPARDLRVTLPATPMSTVTTATGRVRGRWSRRTGTTVTEPGARRIRWPRPRVVLAVLAAITAGTALAAVVLAVWVAVAWLIAHLAVIGAVLAALAVLFIVAGTGACTTVIRVTHHH